MKASEESIDDRVDYLADDKVRDILKRVIAALIADGAMAASDILCSHSLLTNQEAFRIFANSNKAR